MSGSGNDTSSGDSAPSFDFLREHDDGSRTQWPTDPEHDSATDMLPPEEEETPQPPPDLPPAAQETEQRDANESKLDENESGSSIHRPVTAPPREWPDSTVVTGPREVATADEAAGPQSDDSALDDVVDTVSQVAHAIEGEPSVETAPAAAAPRTDTVPSAPRHNLFLVALASYASAVTIALLYLLFQRATTDPSVLESLPDVPPLRQDEVMLRVPVDADMPPGHTLRLGQAQRFGNILVEPLRVVREPVAFVHFSDRDNLTRPDTEPVLKLWVRFTNESRNQSIAPLDAQLLFTRVYRPETGEIQANQFVCALDTKRAAGEPVFVYDHSPTAEFDLVDQQLGRVLQPGETFETYIPTAEEPLDSLTGELIWRVHFRKGYSPKGYGVTTVVEVRFDKSDIHSESSAT
jgi:hypothetical protein